MALLMGSVVVLSLTATSIIVYDQGRYCATGRRLFHFLHASQDLLEEEPTAWIPTTQGISAAKYVLRMISNLLWILAGYGATKRDWFIVGGCSIYALSLTYVLILMLRYPPRRPKIARIGIWGVFVLCSLAVLVISARVDYLSQVGTLVEWLPLIASWGFTAPGQIHQIWETCKDKSPGRQTLLESGWCCFDATLWVMYGWVIGKPIVLLACLLIALLFLVQLLNILRFEEKRAELSRALKRWRYSITRLKRVIFGV